MVLVPKYLETVLLKSALPNRDHSEILISSVELFSDDKEEKL